MRGGRGGKNARRTRKTRRTRRTSRAARRRRMRRRRSRCWGLTCPLVFDLQPEHKLQNLVTILLVQQPPLPCGSSRRLGLLFLEVVCVCCMHWLPPSSSRAAHHTATMRCEGAHHRSPARPSPSARPRSAPGWPGPARPAGPGPSAGSHPRKHPPRRLASCRQTHEGHSSDAGHAPCVW